MSSLTSAKTASASVTSWHSSRLVLLVMCVLYYALLAYQYREVDSIVYAYVGLGWHPPSFGYFLAGAGLAILPLMWMSGELCRPSQVACWWLYVSIVIPATFVPFHVIDDDPLKILQMSAMLTLSFGLLCWVAGMKPITLPQLKGMGTLLSIALSLYVIAMIGILALVVGFQVTFSLESVYARRMESRETLPAGSALAYGFATLQKSVVPILIAHGITRRSVVWVGMGLLGAIVCFSVGGQKTTFFMPMFLIAISYVVSRLRHGYGFYQFVGVIAILLVCLSEVNLRGTSELTAYLSRRLLYAPAQLHAYYFSFFSENGFTNFAGSLLRWLPTSQGVESSGYLIGHAFFGNSEINANGNIWAYGYSEWGLSGMLLTSLLLGTLLRVIDGIATQGKFMLCCLMAGVMGLSWAEASLISSLLSAGVVVSIVILHLLDQEEGRTSAVSVPARPKLLPPLHGNLLTTRHLAGKAGRHGQGRARHVRA